MVSNEKLRAWHQLPAEAAGALRPELPGLAREILAAIRHEVPTYARPLDGPFGRGLTAGVEEALSQFLDGIEAGRPMPRSRVYVDLGRGEMRAGRSLDALLKAYRVGARVAWRRFSAAGMAAGLEPETLYSLAESIFAYIDELSAKSAEGYALEQSTTVGEQRAQRQRLVRLLVRDPPADPVEVAEVARAAEWRLPEQLAALAFPEADAARILPRLPAEAIVETLGEIVCALVPDPELAGRRADLERAVGLRHRAALGPSVGWAESALSLSRARAVLELAAEGRLTPDRGLLDTADHLGSLLLRGDERLVAEIARTRLAPLRELPAGPRARLTETLAAWLACQGRLQASAERLHIHPQTMRYRLGQLRQVFGEALEDEDARFELELALRAVRGGAVKQGGIVEDWQGRTAAALHPSNALDQISLMVYVALFSGNSVPDSLPLGQVNPVSSSCSGAVTMLSSNLISLAMPLLLIVLSLVVPLYRHLAAPKNASIRNPPVV